MEIEYSSRAGQQLEKLKNNKALLVRIFTSIEELEINPLVGKQLEGEYGRMRSLRVGDWRVIYEFDQSNQKVLVIRVAKRSEVYR